MRMNYKEKIDKINSDRITILSMTKEKIANDNGVLSESLESVVAALDFDDQNTKEYVSIVNAKQLIFEFTQQVANATTVDEVINLRKKINYYINKIKKELLKRNVSQEQFDKMYNDVSGLRNNIAMYLRSLKREETILEIARLYDNIDSLVPEDIEKIKKLLSNELRYNKRILNQKSNEIEKIKKNDVIETVTVADIIAESDERYVIEPASIPQQSFLSDFYEFIRPIRKNDDSEEDILDIDQNYLDERLKYYDSHYCFKGLFSYNESFFKNFINLFRNIPRYSKNRKVIKAIERDYDTFYHGQDLGGLLHYSKKRNSIFTALSVIFKSSRLSQREIECLYNHENCKEWIMEFYKPKDDAPRDCRKFVRIR